jgi:hypothetical protein
MPGFHALLEGATAGAVNGNGADPRKGDRVLRRVGLEVEGRTLMEGEFVDTVTGIPDSCSQIVMLRLPGGGTGLELSRR